MPSFNLKDSVLTITRGQVSEVGIVPAGTPFRIVSHTKLSFDPGGKATHLKGSLMLPLDVTIQTAEPKIDIDCSDGREVGDALDAVGGIGSTVLLSLTMARVGLIPLSYLWPGTWMNGGGIELDEGKGFGPDKISILATDCLRDLVSIYNALA